jgi:hypothetical protein
MKRWLAVVALVALTGCASIKDMVPSFWDDNQAAAIINVRQSVVQLNCKQEHLPQAEKIFNQIQWFELYSESRGHRDMERLTKPMHDTAKEFLDRSKTKQGSEVYCELKKKFLIQQSQTAASAIMGRF